MRIALAGTRGVPASYGGFETAVEEIGRRMVERGHEVIVYGRGQRRSGDYLGMTVVDRPVIQRKSLETLTHGFSCLPDLLRRRPDCTFVFNAANMPSAAWLRLAGLPFAVHVDGIEWARSKWGTWGRRYYLAAERAAVLLSPALIADAQGISDYYQERYGVTTVPIAYGAPSATPRIERLHELGLSPRGYDLVVARLEPENHVLELVQGYSMSRRGRPLVVVGDAPYADTYKAKIAQAAGPEVRMVGAVYDQELLTAVYAGARVYLHGHSVGGTNPSLLRAAAAGISYVLAWDTPFNREVIESDGEYFTGALELHQILSRDHLSHSGERLRDSVRRRYDWDDVTDRYLTLAKDLAARKIRRLR